LYDDVAHFTFKYFDNVLWHITYGILRPVTCKTLGALQPRFCRFLAISIVFYDERAEYFSALRPVAKCCDNLRAVAEGSAQLACN